MHINRRESGFTLVEILVATVILAVGILGVASLQLTSFQTSQSAYARSQAIYITQDIFDRIRANPDAYRNASAYDDIDSSDTGSLPSDPSCIAASGGCSALELAQQDIREWTANFNNVFNTSGYRPTMPNGRGVVTRDGTSNDFTATVSWDEKDWSGADRVVQTRQVSIRATVN